MMKSQGDKNVLCYLHKEKYYTALIKEVSKYFFDEKRLINGGETKFKLGNYTIYPKWYSLPDQQIGSRRRPILEGINRKMTLFVKQNP